MKLLQTMTFSFILLGFASLGHASLKNNLDTHYMAKTKAFVNHCNKHCPQKHCKHRLRHCR